MRQSSVDLEEEGEYEYVAYHHSAENGEEEAHIEPALLIQPLVVSESEQGNEGRSEGAMASGSVVPRCTVDSQAPCARPARGGEGTCKTCRKRHHGGGGHGGTPEAKKSCPPGYLTIPVIDVCFKIELPDIGNHPAPGPGPNTFPYPAPIE